MAHPVYPLLETAYDAEHRAHFMVDEGMVRGFTYSALT